MASSIVPCPAHTPPPAQDKVSFHFTWSAGDWRILLTPWSSSPSPEENSKRAFETLNLHRPRFCAPHTRYLGASGLFLKYTIYTSYISQNSYGSQPMDFSSFTKLYSSHHRTVPKLFLAAAESPASSSSHFPSLLTRVPETLIYCLLVGFLFWTFHIEERI